MKNLTVALLCLIVLSGCKKSDKNLSDFSITGKWTLTKTKYQYFNGNTLLRDSDKTFTAVDKYFKFNTDGTGTSNVTESSAFTNVVNPVATATGDFIYRISDSNIALVYKILPNTTFTRSILLSNNELIMRYEETSDYYGNTQESIKITIAEYYSK